MNFQQQPMMFDPTMGQGVIDPMTGLVQPAMQNPLNDAMMLALLETMAPQPSRRDYQNSVASHLRSAPTGHGEPSPFRTERSSTPQTGVTSANSAPVKFQNYAVHPKVRTEMNSVPHKKVGTPNLESRSNLSAREAGVAADNGED